MRQESVKKASSVFAAHAPWLRSFEHTKNPESLSSGFTFSKTDPVPFQQESNFLPDTLISG